MLSIWGRFVEQNLMLSPALGVAKFIIVNILFRSHFVVLHKSDLEQTHLTCTGTNTIHKHEMNYVSSH